MIVIYLITNLISGKRYVGVTRQKLQRRWRGHVQFARKGVKTALHAAIRKYGEENFTVEPIASCLSEDWIGISESSLIIQYGTKAPNGYNLTDGGDGVKGLSEETRRRIGKLLTGRKHTAEALELIRLSSIGRKKSIAARAAISKAHKGKHLSAEHRAKLSAAKIGRKRPTRSDTHKARISEGLRRAHARRRGENGGLSQRKR